MKIVLSTLIFLSALPAFANCSRVETFLGYEVRCRDGNRYRVEESSLTGQTVIKGSNLETGSTWRHEYNPPDSLLGPSSKHIDSQGNVTRCRYNEFLGKTTCTPSN